MQATDNIFIGGDVIPHYLEANWKCKFYKIEAKKKVNTNAKIYAY